MTSQPTHKAWDEQLEEILFELTDQSAWDLIGITQSQADALSELLAGDRSEAKQAINAAVLELVVGEDEHWMTDTFVQKVAVAITANRIDKLDYRNRLRTELRQTITGKPNPQ